MDQKYERHSRLASPPKIDETLLHWNVLTEKRNYDEMLDAIGKQRWEHLDSLISNSINFREKYSTWELYMHGIPYDLVTEARSLAVPHPQRDSSILCQAIKAKVPLSAIQSIAKLQPEYTEVCLQATIANEDPNLILEFLWSSNFKKTPSIKEDLEAVCYGNPLNLLCCKLYLILVHGLTDTNSVCYGVSYEIITRILSMFTNFGSIPSQTFTNLEHCGSVKRFITDRIPKIQEEEKINKRYINAASQLVQSFNAFSFFNHRTTRSLNCRLLIDSMEGILERDLSTENQKQQIDNKIYSFLQDPSLDITNRSNKDTILSLREQGLLTDKHESLITNRM